MPLIAILTSLPIRTVSPSLGKPTKKVGFERQTLRTLRNEIQCYYLKVLVTYRVIFLILILAEKETDLKTRQPNPKDRVSHKCSSSPHNFISDWELNDQRFEVDIF
jgi:hypothetical protein